MGDGDRSQKAHKETSQQGRSGTQAASVKKMKGGIRLERENNCFIVQLSVNINHIILLGRATLGPDLSAGQPSAIPQHQ